MDREIDEIFLHTKEPTADAIKIENLKACTRKIPDLYPYIDLVLEQVEDIRKYFSIYDIQLDALAVDLKSIQDKNKHIKDKNEHENAIYNHLKELCLTLTMDKSHFQILENGSFTDLDDLVKMEKSLGILGAVDLSKYSIRIVKEKISEITDSQRNFLKRFVTFLSKLLIKSESSGELKVHKTLYKSISLYKFIYAFSKKYEDYYSILCSAYATHSKKMYEIEFENHLDSIYDMVKDINTLALCFDILTKGYSSLVGCEINFIKDMDIDVSVDTIFKNINTLIIEFVSDMFKKSSLGTLLPIGAILKNSVPSNETYGEFKDELSKTYEVLEESYIKTERETDPSATQIDRLNLALNSDCTTSLKDKLLDAVVKNLIEDIKNTKIDKFIYRLQLLHSIQSTENKVKDALGIITDVFPRKIIDYVFSSEQEISNAKTLIEMVDMKNAKATEILESIRSVVIENASDNRKEGFTRLFARIFNK